MSEQEKVKNKEKVDNLTSLIENLYGDLFALGTRDAPKRSDFHQAKELIDACLTIPVHAERRAAYDALLLRFKEWGTLPLIEPPKGLPPTPPPPPSVKGKASEIKSSVPVASEGLKEETSVILKELILKNKSANVAEIDMKLVEKNVEALKINKDEIVKQVQSAMLEVNPFFIVLTLLNNPKVYDIFGLCTVRLILRPEMRTKVDEALTSITVLQNRAGKLMKSTCTILGFVGLALVSTESRFKPLLKFIRNPLLGESPEERAMRKIAGESAADKRERLEAHKEGFTAYKALMESFKTYSKEFNEIPEEVKQKVKEKIITWLE